QSYHQIALIKVPGVPPQKGAFSYDISWVDPASHRYYLADRTSKAVDVIETTTNKLVAQLAKAKFAGFTGKPDTSGPDGVLVIPGDSVAWVGDAPGLIKAVNLHSGAIVSSISNGGKNRADELAYDPQDHLIVIANNADEPPFITFISTTSRKVVGKITYTSAGGWSSPRTIRRAACSIRTSCPRRRIRAAPSTRSTPRR